ncbi:DNA-binding protein [Pelagibius sp. Alg239-R121]|uniref:helix-turn-helix domain-containing transcriptional regulator n=1 Tax=Pelagibius sp. Alg239-R121 TaxID=2993448 RepID=UPI0024A716EE|nr:hypothetical protein [Pelagibius sp. Alg239-R121]
MTNKHRGPTLGEFLEEEGNLEEVTQTALRRVARAKLSAFDAADYLETEEDIVLFLREATETGDQEYIDRATRTVARARRLSVKNFRPA